MLLKVPEHQSQRIPTMLEDVCIFSKLSGLYVLCQLREAPCVLKFQERHYKLLLSLVVSSKQSRCFRFDTVRPDRSAGFCQPVKLLKFFSFFHTMLPEAAVFGFGLQQIFSRVSMTQHQH